MVDLVTQQVAADHLRTTIAVDGAWLQVWIPVISDAVALWLKDDWRLYVPETDSAGDIYTDSNGDPIPSAVIRPVVQGAVLVELASVFRFREGEGTDNVVTPDAGYGYMLNKTSTAMLAALRKSTVA